MGGVELPIDSYLFGRPVTCLVDPDKKVTDLVSNGNPPEFPETRT